MKCTSPLYLVHSATNMGYVPCGSCIACRITKTRNWTTRILHEYSTKGKGCFVTLTYNDQCSPIDGALAKRHLQKFFKRLRSELEPWPDARIKYFACGEYGPETHRPHYHAIILGIGPQHSDLINSCWGMGFTKTSVVNETTINYVTGYVRKKLTGKAARSAYGIKQPPFQIQSQGMGLEWAIQNKEQIQTQGTITVGGKPVGIPPYYRKKLGLDLSFMTSYNEEARERKHAHYKKIGLSPLDEALYVRAQREQRAKEMEARFRNESKKL